jgi:hypothetical protein
MHKRTEPFRGMVAVQGGGSVHQCIQHETSMKRPKLFWRQWNVQTFWRQKVISATRPIRLPPNPGRDFRRTGKPRIM